jgi:CheY-like chemotaxis protein
MAKAGTIVIVEDDRDDQEIMQDVLKELGVENKLEFFDNCYTALHYLKTIQETPFLIICDINLPAINGFDFRKQIEEDETLKRKSVPFVFFSTASNKSTVQEAYSQLTIQGYFEKEHTYAGMKKALSLIIEYWKLCKHPDE